MEWEHDIKFQCFLREYGLRSEFRSIAKYDKREYYKDAQNTFLYAQFSLNYTLESARKTLIESDAVIHTLDRFYKGDKMSKKEEPYNPEVVELLPAQYAQAEWEEIQKQNNKFTFIDYLGLIVIGALASFVGALAVVMFGPFLWM